MKSLGHTQKGIFIVKVNFPPIKSCIVWYCDITSATISCRGIIPDASGFPSGNDGVQGLIPIRFAPQDFANCAIGTRSFRAKELCTKVTPQLNFATRRVKAFRANSISESWMSLCEDGASNALMEGLTLSFGFFRYFNQNLSSENRSAFVTKVVLIPTSQHLRLNSKRCFHRVGSPPMINKCLMSTCLAMKRSLSARSKFNVWLASKFSPLV